MDTVAKAPLTMCLASMAFAEGTTSTLSTTGTNAYLICNVFVFDVTDKDREEYERTSKNLNPIVDLQTHGNGTANYRIYL